MRNTAAENGSGMNVHHFLKPVLFGLIVGLVICILSFIVCSFIMISRDIPQSFVSMFAILSASLGGFFAGFVSAKIARSKGLLLGLACGVIISFVILVAGFSVMKQLLGLMLLVKSLMIIAASCLGGVLGGNSRIRRRKS